MEFVDNILASDNYLFLALLAIAVVFLWFLPALLALVFNRKHFKLILVACIPAGFSLIAWGGVLIWATTGKAVDKYANRGQNQA